MRGMSLTALCFAYIQNTGMEGYGTPIVVVTTIFVDQELTGDNSPSALDN